MKLDFIVVLKIYVIVILGNRKVCMNYVICTMWGGGFKNLQKCHVFYDWPLMLNTEQSTTYILLEIKEDTRRTLYSEAI